MDRHFQDEHVVSSTAPGNPIFICGSNDSGVDLFQMDSNMMNVTNAIGYQLHISLSKSTGELTIREVLSDQTVQTQRAVSGHLTLYGGSYAVNQFGPGLAKGGLDAFFIRITLLGTLRQAGMRLDNARWNKTVQGQLRLQKCRTLFKHTKILKIWIANFSSNPNFDKDILRGAFEHGGALPMFSEPMVRSRGYQDLDAVSGSDNVQYLDYGEALKPPEAIPQVQPTWFEFGHQSTQPGEFGQTMAHDSGSVFGAPEQAKWKDSRLSELEDQLKIQTAATKIAQSTNASLRHSIDTKNAIARESRNEILQLRNLLQSRDLMLAIFNEEYITRAQPDIAALATALAIEKGIRRGDHQGIRTGIPSLYVGQSTVDRLFQNPYFISKFLDQQQDSAQRKRGGGSEGRLEVLSDDDSAAGKSCKKMRLE